MLTLLLQRKWHTVRCNWRPEDVVIRQIRTCCEEIIAWHLTVKEVFPGEDRKVRRVAIQYIKSYRSGERANEYRGARDTVVSRAVQRLALLVSAE